jgi:hypothetical protein
VNGFVIVIEGIDKSGKTSLAAALSSMLGWPVVKCVQPGPGGAVREYMAKLRDNPGPFIADRFHLGESVYGPLYRRTPRLSNFEVESIENLLGDRGALLVLMEDRPDRIVERFKKLDENFARAVDVEPIVREFEHQWRRSRLAKIRATWDAALPGVVSDVVRRMTALWRAKEYEL